MSWDFPGSQVQSLRMVLARSQIASERIPHSDRQGTLPKGSKRYIVKTLVSGSWVHV